MSGGFFVETAVGEHRQGDLLPASSVIGGELSLLVRVQAPSWVPAAKLEIVVNGQVVKTVDVPASPVLRLEQQIEVPIPEGVDSYVLARVRTGANLPFPYPGAPAWGFSNPFFVDANGNAKFDARLPMP